MNEKELKAIVKRFWAKLKEIEADLYQVKLEASGSCFCDERKIDEMSARLERIEQTLKERRKDE